MLPLLTSLALAAPSHVELARDRVDWDAASSEAATVLSGYLRVPSVNPPGGELEAVRYLGKLLDREGIAWEASGVAPGRPVLIARLDSAIDDEPPLCLLHHTDVVGFEEAEWTHPPLSGHIDEDGVIWGRGALDMKGQGIAQLMAMTWLKRLELPLRRDVVLLAVPDEEVDNTGMAYAVEGLWDRIGCSQLINEGGIGVRDALLDGMDSHVISVAEKGILWVRVVAEGPAGHGSTIVEGEAPEQLRRAVDAILDLRTRPHIDPAVYELLANHGRARGGVVGAVLRSRALVDLLVKPKLMANSATHAAITDTIHLTGYDAGDGAPNVVPSRASATFDIRLLPRTSPEAMQARLQDAIEGIDGVSIEVLLAEPSTRSPMDDPLYEALTRYAVEGQPNAAAGPALSVGFTDSMFARKIGVHCYGYAPFVLSQEELETMHGHDERLPTAELGRGVRVLFSVLADLAVAPQPRLIEVHPPRSSDHPSPGTPGASH